MAATAATLLGGIPSTLAAWLAGGDVTQAVRAAGAMLLRADAGTADLLVTGALLHGAISFFWASVLMVTLPRRRIIVWAVVAGTIIGVVDLRLIGRAFPEIYALDFWPQLADHVAWGLTVGLVLHYRAVRRLR